MTTGETIRSAGGSSRCSLKCLRGLRRRLALKAQGRAVLKLKGTWAWPNPDRARLKQVSLEHLLDPERLSPPI